MKRVLSLSMFLALAFSFAVAQSNAVDLHTAAQLHQFGVKLKAEALKAPDGIAVMHLEKYPGHFTMLTCRTKTGGAEEHAHFSDIFYVVEGDATLMTGGSIANAKTISPGETRGPAVSGGTPHKLSAGEFVHISPNTPHQLILAPGHHFLYYVVKLQQ